MKARAESLRFLGEMDALDIPFFQRKYVWRAQNWKELLDSFDNIDNHPFLGSLILKHTRDRKITIIDGQQRLTTISLLAKAIYDTLASHGYKLEGSGIRKDIESFLFYMQNCADDFADSIVKIQHSRLDHEDFEKVIRSGLFEDSPSIDCSDLIDKLDDADIDDILTENEEFFGEDSRIIQCYKYFILKLKDRTDTQLKDLHKAVFGKENRVFVVIELEYDDINEQRIFDTINRAGVRLSTADIIKNNLFKNCLECCKDAQKQSKDVYALYDKQWNDVFYANTEDYDLWETRRVFGNVERTNLEFLLYCVASIKWRKDKDIFSQLDKFYAEKIQDYTFSELQGLICEIADYAKIFKKCILTLQQDFLENESVPSFSYTNHIERLLLILEKFGVQMFYPYVLKRLKECNIKDLKDCDDITRDVTRKTLYERLVHDFSILSSFVVRRRLAGKGVHDYATKCDKILHEQDGLINELIREMVNPLSEINNKEFANAIQKIKNNENAKIVLYNIELYRRDDEKYDIKDFSYIFTLEHILPKKWEKNWKDVDVYNRNGDLVQGEEVKATRDGAILSLGNMLLLTSKLNTSVSNNTFEVKIKGNGRYHGYKKYSDLCLTKEIIAEYDSGKTVWDERRIVQREQELFGDVLKIWPDFSEELPPEVKDLETDDTEGMTVDSFSEEVFDDPIKLLTAIGMQESGEIKVKSDLYKDFLDYVMKMTMSYSYKPVLLKALFELSDETGAAVLDEIVKYFKEYYDNRRASGLIVEATDSAFVKEEIDENLAKKTIITYPYERFRRRGFLDFSAGKIVFNAAIWSKLTEQDKAIILENCEQKLAQYYKRFEEQ